MTQLKAIVIKIDQGRQWSNDFLSFQGGILLFTTFTLISVQTACW